MDYEALDKWIDKQLKQLTKLDKDNAARFDRREISISVYNDLAHRNDAKREVYLTVQSLLVD